MKTVSKKHQVITRLFEGLRSFDERSEVLNFNTETVKQISSDVAFKNPFDATKFDTYEILPDCLKDAGYFIVHLGRGDHAFVKGNGYHYLEPIEETKLWKSEGSILDKLGTSEASAISTLYNEKIIHDFLFSRTDVDLKVHTARRSNATYKFRIGKNDLYATYLQLEIDGFFEVSDLIVPVEVKHRKQTNFEIRQLFTMMKYFELNQKLNRIPSKYKIRYLFINRFHEKDNEFYRLYEYRFKNPVDFNSIQFVRAVQYNMTGASTLPL